MQRAMCNKSMMVLPTLVQSSTGLKKANHAGPSPLPEKAMWSRIYLVQHWTDAMDAGMSMLALVSLMPMSSYGLRTQPVRMQEERGPVTSQTL